MTRQGSDDVEQLMPNLQLRMLQQTSPENTAALRKYIRVLSETDNNVQQAPKIPQKPRTDCLEPRAGTGRHPPRRFFTIKLKINDEAAAVEQIEDVDPEGLKDALLAQARHQRQALVDAVRRPGTGRVPRQRDFSINMPPPTLFEPELDKAEEAVEVPVELARQQQVEQQQPEEVLGEDGWEQQLVAPAAQQQRVLDTGDAVQEWAPEQGTLQEQAYQAAYRPALAAAATPAGALLQNSACSSLTSSKQPMQADSQLALRKTPGSSLLGRYTPVEGVPERLTVAPIRSKLLPDTVLRSASGAGLPAGFTPQEGVPERLQPFRPLSSLRPLPGITSMGNNDISRSVDSPVDGWVQQIGQGGSCQAPCQAVVTDDGFGGFAQPDALQSSWQQQQPQQSAQGCHEENAAIVSDGDDDNGDCDFGDHDGGYEEDPPGDMDLHAQADPQPATERQRLPAVLIDACMQTSGNLLGGEDGRGASCLVGNADLAVGDGLHAGCDDGSGEFQQDWAEASAAAHQQARRRQTQNPGVRLRNELKRKSLAADPGVGRQEVLPGVRRSSRAKQEPLKWWLNEKKEFARKHKTMPTVRNVVHKIPNTPWQTVTDIKRRPAKRQRAPTPHDLELALQVTATGASGDEQEYDEQQPTQHLQRQQQHGASQYAEDAERQPEGGAEKRASEAPRGRRQQATLQHAGGRSSRCAAGKAPAAKGAGRAAGKRRRR